MIKGIAGISFLLWAIVFIPQAQATHIQFNTATDVLDYPEIGYDDTWSTTFDLLNDDMVLWNLDSNSPYGMGSYDPADDLHYVTLRIDPNNYNGDPSSTYLELSVNGISILDWVTPIRLYDWGIPNNPISDPYNIVGNNYKVQITLTGLEILGDNTIPITNINLEGCFDTNTPIPEPATMFLFGSSLAGLAGTMIRKKKNGSSLFRVLGQSSFKF